MRVLRFPCCPRHFSCPRTLSIWDQNLYFQPWWYPDTLVGKDDLTGQCPQNVEVKKAETLSQIRALMKEWAGREWRSQDDLGYLEVPQPQTVAPSTQGKENATVRGPSYLEHLIQKNPIETRCDNVLLLPSKEVTNNSKEKLCGLHGLFYFILFFNNFTEVWLTYNKLNLLEVYNLIIFDICIQLWNHHYNRDNEHIHHPGKLPPLPALSPVPHPSSGKH